MDTAVRKEPAAHMAPIAVDHIPVSSIRPSPTNPRKHFDKAALQELADSFRAQGVLVPLIVRPVPGKGAVGVKYELVAGERRWRAARLAELAHVPAMIRELTDAEVLEIQITENLQRQDLLPMEEAEGYEALIKLKRSQGETLLAEQIADKIGRSRAYVYQRIKLLELCPAGRKALAEGKLDVSRALLVARIPSEKLQKEAIEAIVEGDYDGPLSYRDARDHIEEHFMLRLAEAPFDTKDAGLVEKAGPCATCPKRTGNQPDLFGDVRSKDVCTDPPCFEAKKQALAERTRKELEAKGKTVIAGEDAEAIVRESYYGDGFSVGGGYIALDDTCRDDPKGRKVREVVGAKHADKVEVVQGPKGKGLVEVIKTSALKEILNEKGVKTEGQKRAEQAKKTRARNEKEALEERIIQGVLKSIHDKHKGKPGREDLLLVATALVDRFDSYSTEYGVERMESALGKRIGHLRTLIKPMKPDELVRFSVLMSLVLLETTPEIRAVAKRCKVDEKKIRRDVLAGAANNEDNPEEETDQ